MIKKGAKLTIQRIPLECIQVKEYQKRYVDRLLHYIKLLQKYPYDDPGLLFLVPSDTHQGMFALLDGHHKFCSCIMEGRKDVLSVIVEE